MKTIAITRWGGLLLLCSLMLFLMLPAQALAQEVITITLPDVPSTYTTKNGTVIREGPPPAIRRDRPTRPQDKATGERSPKEPWDQDVSPPTLEAPAPEAVDNPLADAPDDVGTKDAAAAKAVPMAIETPATAPDVASTFELGMDGLRPGDLRPGTPDALIEILRAELMEAPMPGPGEAPQPGVAKRLQGGQQLAAVSDEIDVPDDFALEANYPNPFNPQTTIRFAIPEASYVRIQVFDLLGREVAMLVDGTLSAGRHEVVFDATSLASGLYVYRMDAGTFEQHRTMLLMK